MSPPPARAFAGVAGRYLMRTNRSPTKVLVRGSLSSPLPPSLPTRIIGYLISPGLNSWQRGRWFATGNKLDRSICLKRGSETGLKKLCFSPPNTSLRFLSSRPDGWGGLRGAQSEPGTLRTQAAYSVFRPGAGKASSASLRPRASAALDSAVVVLGPGLPAVRGQDGAHGRLARSRGPAGMQSSTLALAEGGWGQGKEDGAGVRGGGGGWLDLDRST